jgi:hypothetical protein
MLENRMRKPTRSNLNFVQNNNEESIKTLKSTDSKKMQPLNNKLVSENKEES